MKPLLVSHPFRNLPLMLLKRFLFQLDLRGVSYRNSNADTFVSDCLANAISYRVSDNCLVGAVEN